MKYKILDAQNAIELEKRINKHLDDGWKCQGGINVFESIESLDEDRDITTDVWYYHQAIVK